MASFCVADSDLLQRGGFVGTVFYCLCYFGVLPAGVLDIPA